MSFVLFVFTSRHDAMALYDYCLRERWVVQIVNTPREVSASCGVSVRALWQNRRPIGAAAKQMRSFVGAYWVEAQGTRQRITRLPL